MQLPAHIIIIIIIIIITRFSCLHETRCVCRQAAIKGYHISYPLLDSLIYNESLIRNPCLFRTMLPMLSGIRSMTCRSLWRLTTSRLCARLSSISYSTMLRQVRNQLCEAEDDLCKSPSFVWANSASISAQRQEMINPINDLDESAGKLAEDLKAGASKLEGPWDPSKE